ncbi:hypothetical protein EON65_12450 [archaeon]|nr:MAG: hypothetical protein EON65_12450 [archaeon]
MQRRFQASTSANTSSSSPSSAPQLMTFAAFQQAYVKQHCADYGECLTHMLRQVRGCSLPSAMALTRQFSTMKKLGKFFREVDKGFATVSLHIFIGYLSICLSVLLYGFDGIVLLPLEIHFKPASP